MKKADTTLSTPNFVLNSDIRPKMEEIEEMYNNAPSTLFHVTEPIRENVHDKKEENGSEIGAEAQEGIGEDRETGRGGGGGGGGAAAGEGREILVKGGQGGRDMEEVTEQGMSVHVPEEPRGYFTQNLTSDDNFQKEIDKWEEFYDGMKTYLSTGKLPDKSTSQITRQADSFAIDNDGNLYHKKSAREGTTITLMVVRNYEDRQRICKDIHLNTGDDSIHHRRDPMLELLGQQYYWKGQRRDVCECIATCERCSRGLGGKRRSKPPAQKRDVRPPKKLLKFNTPPLTATSPVTPSNPHNVCVEVGQTPIPIQNQPLATTECTESNNPPPSSHFLPSSYYSHLPPSHALPASSRILVPTSFTFDQSSQIPSPAIHVSSYTPTTQTGKCATSTMHKNEPSSLLTGKPGKASVSELAAQPVMLSRVSGFQIFSTINEPSGDNINQGTSKLLPSPSLSCTNPSQAISKEKEEFITQGSVQEEEAEVEHSSDSSIYQLLFDLPSQLNTAIFDSVIEAMHMALQHRADSVQLAEAAGNSISQICRLRDTFTAVICPSRAAAYITALAAAILRQDPLGINPLVSTQRSTPPVVLHDACCQAGSPKLCSALVGASNWNLGTITTPMDRVMLTMAVASNRVAAIFHRPYAYPRNSSILPLNLLSSICHAQGSDIALLVDIGDMPIHDKTLTRLSAAFQDMLMNGTDALLLPETEQFQGPPNTCVLLGQASLLGSIIKQLPLLQSQLGLPLICSAYDVVGTVVALKTLQVSAN